MDHKASKGGSATHGVPARYGYCRFGYVQLESLPPDAEPCTGGEGIAMNWTSAHGESAVTESARAHT